MNEGNLMSVKKNKELFTHFCLTIERSILIMNFGNNVF